LALITTSLYQASLSAVATLQLNKQLLREMPSAKANRRLGLTVEDMVKLPTLLGSRMNSAKSLEIVRGYAADSKRTAVAPSKGVAHGQKGCVWDAMPSNKSLCKGEDLQRHIHHLKVSTEAAKGLSLTDVCRISMRTRDLLAHRLQWSEISAMAELHLQAKTKGQVTEDEFVSVLRPFTEDVLDDDERKTLFKRLDGEKRGYVTLQLTEAEHRKCEELTQMRKGALKATNVSHAISGTMHPYSVDAHKGNPRMQPQAFLPVEIAEELQTPVSVTPQMQDNFRQTPAEHIVSSSGTNLENGSEVVIESDEELQQLEHRLEELRAAQAARLRRRRKRDLEAEIGALQRELEAKTPTAKTPHASESPQDTKSRVSFALPETLQPCEVATEISETHF